MPTEEVGDPLEPRAGSTVQEVVAKEPAALLMIGVSKMGSPRAGGDAGGGRANGLAYEPKEDGKGDGVLGI